MRSKMKPIEPATSRQAAGHTQEEAAALLGVSRRGWQEWD